MARAPLTDGGIELDKMDADPQPTTRRGPGRPRKTETADAPKSAGNRGKIAARTASGTIMSRAAMIAKVESELYTYFSLAVATWEIKDPECAGMMLEQVVLPTDSGPVRMERLAAIVNRLTAIIARNDRILAMLAKSGLIGEAAVLGSLLVPVGRQIWAAHGPTGDGHARGVDDVTAEQYPAYRPTAA